MSERGPDVTAQQTRAARRAPDKPAASCPECLAWGVLYGGYCRACYDFRRRHPRAACAVCARVVPLKNSHCRLCWLQAASLSADPPVVTEDDLARVTCHQLWFAGMTKMRGPRSGVRLRAGLRGSAVALRSPEPKPLDTGNYSCTCQGLAGLSTGPGTPSPPAPRWSARAGSPKRWARAEAGTPSWPPNWTGRW